jgi:hypothetical protein
VVTTGVRGARTAGNPVGDPFTESAAGPVAARQRPEPDQYREHPGHEQDQAGLFDSG